MSEIQMIPVAEIRVLNPRARNKAKFLEIVGNISKLGLKKPIAVSRRGTDDGGYDLVCGQGRLEAYFALGQTEVPAVVVVVPREDRFIMSLVENIPVRFFGRWDATIPVSAPLLPWFVEKAPANVRCFLVNGRRRCRALREPRLRFLRRNRPDSLRGRAEGPRSGPRVSGAQGGTRNPDGRDAELATPCGAHDRCFGTGSLQARRVCTLRP